jgi:CHAD domain-containing protein
VRFGTFIHELDLLAKEGSSRTEPLDARSVMRPRWRALRDAVGALDTPPSDDGLHAVRIETKRLRYAAELFRPVGGARCRRCIRRATRLQEVLGAQHDAARAREWLIDRELMDATTAAALGWIAADATAQRDLGRESWRPTWRSLERPKARFW